MKKTRLQFLAYSPELTGSIFLNTGVCPEYNRYRNITVYDKLSTNITSNNNKHIGPWQEEMYTVAASGLTGEKKDRTDRQADGLAVWPDSCFTLAAMNAASVMSIMCLWRRLKTQKLLSPMMICSRISSVIELADTSISIMQCQHSVLNLSAVSSANGSWGGPILTAEALIRKLL